MKTFLVPVDFSGNSVRAIEYAIDLALRADAEVVILHTLERTAILPGLDTSKSREEAAGKLEALIDRGNAANVPVRYIITEGSATGEIGRAIEELGVTLVIMGTGGAKNFTKKMFGTTTESVAKRGLCPVLAIPEGAEIKPIEHIVYAADFENGDQVTAMQLVQLKELMNASLTFLHINSGSQDNFIDNEYIKRELVKQFPQAEINFVEIEEKDVAEGISKYVHENGANLVAFTILNRIFLDKIMHSSVTSRLLQNLNVPMLALPENGTLLDLPKRDRSETNRL